MKLRHIFTQETLQKIEENKITDDVHTKNPHVCSIVTKTQTQGMHVCIAYKSHSCQNVQSHVV